MARRTKVVTIDLDNRDKGKQFTLQEMSAYDAEEWFYNAIQLLAAAGSELPDGAIESGPMGFASMTLKAVLTGLSKAPKADVKDLMDRMMTCMVAFTAPGGQVAIKDFAQINLQIEEPTTRMLIKEAIIDLHVGFSIRNYLTKKAAAKAISAQ